MAALVSSLRGNESPALSKGPSGGFNEMGMDSCVAGTALRWHRETRAHI